MHDGPFVPDGAQCMDEVEDRWRGICSANPDAFDGRICHVLGVHRNGCGGAMIHAIDCAFRFYAVQDAHFDLGVRALGVKGIAMRDGKVLLGRRAASAGRYSGLWEFVPAGVVEPGDDPAEAVERELREESSLHLSTQPRAQVILCDPVAETWEIIYLLEVADGTPSPALSEHDELCWRDSLMLGECENLSPVASRIAELIPQMLRSPEKP